jgi:hypothetical protein
VAIKEQQVGAAHLTDGGRGRSTIDSAFFTEPGFFYFELRVLVRYASRYAALTVGASYDLLHVSRFTPYLTGGTGIYYTGLRRSAVSGVIPTEFSYYNQAYSQNKFGLGANAGLGLKIRLGKRELFVEQMLHELDLKRSPGRAIAPLNVGIRF